MRLVVGILTARKLKGIFLFSSIFSERMPFAKIINEDNRRFIPSQWKRMKTKQYFRFRVRVSVFSSPTHSSIYVFFFVSLDKIERTTRCQTTETCNKKIKKERKKKCIRLFDRKHGSFLVAIYAPVRKQSTRKITLGNTKEWETMIIKITAKFAIAFAHFILLSCISAFIFFFGTDAIAIPICCFGYCPSFSLIFCALLFFHLDR